MENKMESNICSVNDVELLSRRNLLGIAGISLASLTATTISASLPSSEKTSSNAKETFSLATQTKDSVIVDAFAEPNRLVFTVKNNVLFNRPIPFLALSNLPDSASKTEREEAVLRLLSTSGSFVSPHFFYTRKNKFGGKINVQFAFLGPKSKTRRIVLTILLKDGSGNTLTSNIVQCTDQRVLAKEFESLYPHVELLRHNSESLTIDKDAFGKMNSIVVVFQEMPT